MTFEERQKISEEIDRFMGIRKLYGSIFNVISALEEYGLINQDSVKKVLKILEGRCEEDEG